MGRFRIKGFLYYGMRFEKADLWVGAYFKRDSPVEGVTDSRVYVCVVPCFPIHIGRITYGPQDPRP